MEVTYRPTHPDRPEILEAAGEEGLVCVSNGIVAVNLAPGFGPRLLGLPRKTGPCRARLLALLRSTDPLLGRHAGVDSGLAGRMLESLRAHGNSASTEVPWEPLSPIMGLYEPRSRCCHVTGDPVESIGRDPTARRREGAGRVPFSCAVGALAGCGGVQRVRDETVGSDRFSRPARPFEEFLGRALPLHRGGRGIQGGRHVYGEDRGPGVGGPSAHGRLCSTGRDGRAGRGGSPCRGGIVEPAAAEGPMPRRTT